MSLITESKRLLLRTVEFSDAGASFEIYSDPEVMRYVDDGHHFVKLEEAIENIRRGISYQEKYGISHWAVIQKDIGEMIGHCGFNLFEGSSDFELIFHFRKKSWGNGYASEAAEAAIRYAAQKLKVKRIAALTFKDNVSSQKVLLKIGFVICGEELID